MVRITKKGIDHNLNNLILDALLREFKNIRTRESLSNFLNRLLTQDEQIMIKKRLAVDMFFKKGARTKDITESLDVSRATIVFIKRGLKRTSSKKEKKNDSRITARDIRKIKKTPWYPAYKGKGRWQFLNRL
ncbi:MAG: Trp family transcriptional regulator [Patescibacteria group bacterium]